MSAADLHEHEDRKQLSMNLIDWVRLTWGRRKQMETTQKHVALLPIPKTKLGKQPYLRMHRWTQRFNAQCLVAWHVAKSSANTSALGGVMG